MFTGIVQYLYLITIDGKKVYLYADNAFLNKLNLGDSVAIDGVCLTVVQVTEEYCLFELSG